MKRIIVFMIALFLVNGAIAQWYQNDSVISEWLESVYFTDAYTGYAISTSSLMKTTDGGKNWFYILPPVSNCGLSVFFINADTGYISGGENSSISKTIDGGITWTEQSTPYTAYTSMFFTNADTGYLVGCIGYAPTTIGSIEKTTDGGANWINQFLQFKTLWSVFFTDANTGYAVGDSGVIMKTSDGGSNWIAQASGTDKDLFSVSFPAEDTGYIVGDEIALKTTNGGQTWVPLSIGPGKWLFSVCFTDVNTGYAVGGQDILKTTDGGLSWFDQEVTGSGYYECLSVCFPVKDTGYIVGWNTILKTENGGGFPVGIGKQNKNTTNLSLFPNPASTIVTIQSHSKGTLSILNTSGQQLLQQETNETTTSIEVSGWESGVYVVKVVGEDGVRTGKIVKW